MTRSKKLLASAFAAMMMLSVCTACDSSSSEPETTTTTTTTTTTAATVATQATEPPKIEDAIEAKAGDAILYMVDAGWYVTYDGTKNTKMTYGAGVAPITGNGDYTVSVSSDTNGCRYDCTSDVNGELVTGGIDFAAVKVFEGTTLYPNMCIEIKEIRIDGKAIELKAKNYTSSDDGKEMRANIYNKWVPALPDDARDPEGNHVTDFNTYNPIIVNADDFKSWKTIEVDFTVTGIDGEGGTTNPDEGAGTGDTTTTAAAE